MIKILLLQTGQQVHCFSEIVTICNFCCKTNNFSRLENKRLKVKVSLKWSTLLGAKDFFGRQCGEGNVAKSFDHGTLHFILTPLLQQKRARKEKCSPNQGKGKVDNILLKMLKNKLLYLKNRQCTIFSKSRTWHKFQIQFKTANKLTMKTFMQNLTDCFFLFFV